MPKKETPSILFNGKILAQIFFQESNLNLIILSDFRIKCCPIYTQNRAPEELPYLKGHRRMWQPFRAVYK
jgi:hypothetical protein